MKSADCVEVVVEKTEYTKEGVHKGMQGVIFECKDMEGWWEVIVPQYGEKPDIAYIWMREEDLKVIPVMDARINEQIKAEFDRLGQNTGSAGGGISDFQI